LRRRTGMFAQLRERMHDYMVRAATPAIE